MRNLNLNIKCLLINKEITQLNEENASEGV